jgi:hypothetical protein
MESNNQIQESQLCTVSELSSFGIEVFQGWRPARTGEASGEVASGVQGGLRTGGKQDAPGSQSEPVKTSLTLRCVVRRQRSGA